ncbi:MAG: hypothetical protein ACJ8H8_05510 [Geminicoccaceae bacterium]
MATQLDGTRPYQREEPDRVVPSPLPGFTLSPLPPVLPFLGTEEGQYRAERVFAGSILQVLDPARIYEIHKACLTGKPVAMFGLPCWYNEVSVVRPSARAVPFLLGGDAYRATPLSVPDRGTVSQPI